MAVHFAAGARRYVFPGLEWPADRQSPDPYGKGVYRRRNVDLRLGAGLSNAVFVIPVHSVPDRIIGFLHLPDFFTWLRLQSALGLLQLVDNRVDLFQRLRRQYQLGLQAQPGEEVRQMQKADQCDQEQNEVKMRWVSDKEWRRPK